MGWFSRKPAWVSTSGRYSVAFPASAIDATDTSCAEETAVCNYKGVTYGVTEARLDNPVDDAEALESYCHGISMAEPVFDVVDPHARVEGHTAVLFRLGDRGHGMVIAYRGSLVDIRAFSSTTNVNPVDNVRMIRFVNSFKDLAR